MNPSSPEWIWLFTPIEPIDLSDETIQVLRVLFAAVVLGLVATAVWEKWCSKKRDNQ